jgi:exosortase
VALTASSSRSVPAPEHLADLCRAAALFLAALLFAAPVVAAVARDAWTYGNETHLLFIFAGGSWLLRDALKEAPQNEARLSVTLALLAPVIAMYLLGRIAGIAWLGWVACCATALVLVHDRHGMAGVARAAIPLGLIACVAPPPLALVAPISDGIIAATARLAIELLSLAGMDAAIATPMFYVNQYELQLAEACAGLNTVFTLTVCMLLYAYLRHRGDWRRTLLLAALAVPVALLANLLRILLIAGVIVTFGDAAGQGLVHDLAGVMLFAIALLSLIAIDEVLARVRR